MPRAEDGSIVPNSFYRRSVPEIVVFDDRTGQWRMNPNLQMMLRGRSRGPSPEAQKRARAAQISQMVADRERGWNKRKKVRSQLLGKARGDDDSGAWTEHDTQMAEVYQLQGEIERAKAQAEAESGGGLGGILGTGKSLVGRALDVASRPGYAVAGFFDEARPGGDDPNNYTGGDSLLDEFKHGLGGAWQGLQGKEKKGFADVQNTEAEASGGRSGINKNSKLSAPVGLVQDVMFDPTTYAAFGAGAAVKSALKQGGEGLAGKAVKEAYEKTLTETGSKAAARRATQGFIQSSKEIAPERAAQDVTEYFRATGHGVTKTSRAKIAKQAKREYRATQILLGKKVTDKELSEVGKAAADEFAEKSRKALDDAIADEKATREALTTNRQLEFKFAGRTVAASEKLGKVAGTGGKAMRTTRFGNWANRAFRTDSEVGGRIHTMMAEHRNVNSAKYEDQIKEIKSIFDGDYFAAKGGAKIKGASRKERILITRALEKGDPTGLGRLEPMYDEAKRILREIADEEVAAGALKADELVDNYVYHAYKSDNYSKGIGSPLKPSSYGGGTKKFPTLEAAEKAGARPAMDVADMLAQRIAKSYKIRAEHALMDEAVEKFAIDAGGKSIAARELKKTVANEDIFVPAKDIWSKAGTAKYFDKDTADALTKIRTIVQNDKAITQFTNTFDRAQAAFKFAVIGLNPGSQLRNLYGDVFVNMLDGVTNPRVYKWAGGLVRDSESALARKITIGGKTIDGNDILRLYEDRGLKTGFFHADTNILPKTRVGPVGKSGDFIKEVSEKREDFARIAHFIDAMKKESALGRGTLEQISERAAKRVKKYNFDYNDLTDFERRTLRRAVPFYTYMRKNMPLMLETFATRPGRLSVVPKTERALQQMLGERNDETYPGGMEGLVPPWIREMTNVQIQGGSGAQDPVFLQPDLPINQVQEWFGGFGEGEGVGGHLAEGAKQMGQTAYDQLSPFATGLPELAYGQTMSGAPVSQDLRQFLLSQLPVSTVGNAAITGGPEGESTFEGLPGPLKYERVLNFLTGAGIRKVGPSRQKGELRRQQDILQAILAQAKE
jgi:hypothetical protein